MTTTNRSDFTWPFLAQRQRLYDWDQFEFKAACPKDSEPPPPQWFQCADTLSTVPYQQRVRFDNDFRPKPILGDDHRLRRGPDGRNRAERLIEYNAEREANRTAAQNTRPRMFVCPQISLDEVKPDLRETMYTFAYTSSKAMSELASGVPVPRAPKMAPLPEVPACLDSAQFRPPRLYKAINPPRNWRRVSIEWDESQRRMFGGRFSD